MISSEGRGMQADSIAIRMAIPAYPVAAIVDLMKTNRTARIFSVMRSKIRVAFQRTAPGSKRPLLSKAEARQGHALPRLGYFHLYHGSIGRGHFRRTQHRELAEHFAVNLGDEVILAAGILPPDLPEFDALHGHEFFLRLSDYSWD